MLLKIIFLLLGTAFGFVLIMAGVSNYDNIRDMFLLNDFHLYGVIGIAVAVAFTGNLIIKKLKIKSALGDNIDMSNTPYNKNHLIGGLLAGFGWAITGACPGPALALIGFGTLSGLFIAGGIFLGVFLYGQLQK